MTAKALRESARKYVEILRECTWLREDLSADEKLCVACMIDSMRANAMRRPDSIGLALMEIEDAVFSYLLAHRMDVAVLNEEKPAKEKLEMANKARERLRKFNTEYRALHPPSKKSDKPIIGLATRYKQFAIETGGAIDLDPLPDGTPDRRPAKLFMTELLQRQMHDRTIAFPRLPERESQYAGHTYSVGPMGNIVYEKGNDHLIDADRCAVLAHFLDSEQFERFPSPGVQLSGFYLGQ